ncbi:MAG: DNA-protecting protein DprA, partial [Xanthomonadales bacterium]|nr:DNA-protecting protein DprA [Xanthomonadales bacterium]
MRAPQLGGARLVGLADRFGGMGGVVRAGAGALRKAGLADDAIAALKSPDASLLESDLAWLGQQ